MTYRVGQSLDMEGMSAFQDWEDKDTVVGFREDVSRKTEELKSQDLAMFFSTEETPSLPEEIYPSSCLSIPLLLP